MKQTAVEWLLENLISEPYSEEDFNHNAKCWDKAKQMEKEQIINAYEEQNVKWEPEFHEDGTMSITNKFRDAEQYYNETFKSE